MKPDLTKLRWIVLSDKAGCPTFAKLRWVLSSDKISRHQPTLTAKSALKMGHPSG